MPRSWKATITGVAACAVVMAVAQPSSAQRVLGIDVSAWQSSISTANWATLKRATNQQVSGIFGDGRDFVFVRSSRGGTTGEDHRQGGYPASDNTFFTLSQRYDDLYFVQNITRATAAGMFAGSYHFSRPDIIASTTNSGGIPNNGTDEANHFIEMAGAWMRPGYLLPVLDLEAGQTQRTSSELSVFAVDFSARIYAVTGFRPMVYLGQNYANYINSTVPAAIPNLWIARWPNQTDPNSIDVQNIHPPPSPSTANVYGRWNPNFTVSNPYPDGHPWKFWQYASTARLNGYANGGANIDVDVAQGGMEFLKDQLVPALWVQDSDGQWITLTNWNSGVAPVAPVIAPGQLARVGSLTLPATRLPGNNDTVILERPNTNITITLGSGTHTIRRLYARESLVITGGSLTINYVPSADSTPIAAQVSAPVTLSNGNVSVHTLQVDATQVFTLGGGTLLFDTIHLMPASASPGKIAVTGNMNFAPLANATATIKRGAGSGVSGPIDLSGGLRTFNVQGGPAEVDLSVDVALLNGALTKSGVGTMRLTTASGYGGGTIVSNGTLLVNNTNASGTGSGSVTVYGGTLGGTGSVSGVVVVNSGGTIAPGTASQIGRLRIGSATTLGGTTSLRIDRTGGGTATDRLELLSGNLSYGGALVVSYVGPTLVGGEVFTHFSAPTYSGAFTTTTNLPGLNAGLNWYLGGLTANGTIRVNRKPIANPSMATNNAPGMLQIPIVSLTSNDTDPDGNPVTLAGIGMTSTNGISITTNSTSIFYSNPAGVPDRIDYMISDGHGGSATGAVHIAVSPAGRFASYSVVNGNSLTLNFSGQPGTTYYLERSTNLPNFVPIWTNVAPQDGLFNYTEDFEDVNSPSAFYRLRWSP